MTSPGYGFHCLAFPVVAMHIFTLKEKKQSAAKHDMNVNRKLSPNCSPHRTHKILNQ